MLALAQRRLLAALPTVLIVTIVVYSLMALVPGDAAVQLAGGTNASEARIEHIRSELRLDQPFIIQYADWASDALRFDFGTSLISKKPVSTELLSRLPITATIAVFSLTFALLIGLASGVVSAVARSAQLSRGVILFAALGMAIPNFVLAILFISTLAIGWSAFPAVGFTRLSDGMVPWLHGAILPSMSLGLGLAATIARQLRAELIEVLNRPYIKTAWAKGASLSRVVGKHALKNALVPTITLIGPLLGSLVGGTVLVEQVFSIPGIGTYLLSAIQSKDMPALMGVTVIFVVIYLTMTFLADIAYTILNPKIRLGA